MKQTMINEVSTQIQYFNEQIIKNISKQAEHILTKVQKKNDFNDKKKKTTDEIKSTQAS